MLAFLSPQARSAVLRTSFRVITLCAALAGCDGKDDTVRNGDGDNPLGGGGETGDGDNAGDGDGDIPEYTPTGAPCEFGPDADKCEGRASVACTPVLGETATTCDRDEDCGSRELCFESMDPDASTGVCLRLYGECLPLCGGNFDCGAGQQCDIESGACVDEANNDGARFGESCESDSDCSGTCVSVSDEVSECEEQCRVGALSGCGEEDLGASDIACAYFAFTLDEFGEEQGAGDVGVCARLCNCSSECPGAQKCSNLPTRGFAGVCTGGAVPDELSECPAPGPEGAGGASNP
jgi:hypothetical protein